MSSKSQEILDIYKANVMPTYRPSLVLASGKGVTVRDIDNRPLYDFTSGIGVQAVGYSHPKVVKAIQDQAAAMTHCSNLFVNEPATRLAQKLVELSGLGGKVFFCNSGAEANEAAIKLARKWGAANGGRYEIVTFRQGFQAARSRPSPRLRRHGARRALTRSPSASRTPTTTTSSPSRPR